MPPGSRQVFRKFHMVCVFKPLLFFITVYPISLAVGADESHISFPSLPFAPAIAEEHVPDETEHGGLTAFVLPHHNVKRSLGRLPGGIVVNAVLLELEIGNLHFSSSFVSISAPKSSAFRKDRSRLSSGREWSSFLYFTNSGWLSAMVRSSSFFLSTGRSFKAS